MSKIVLVVDGIAKAIKHALGNVFLLISMALVTWLVSLNVVGCRSNDTAVLVKTQASEDPEVENIRAPFFWHRWDSLRFSVTQLEWDVRLHGEGASGGSLQSYSKLLQALKERVTQTQAALSQQESISATAEFSVQQVLATVRKQMPDVIASLEETGMRLKRLSERQGVDASRSEAKRQKYREHLLQGIASQDIAKEALYVDDAVVIYAQAYAPSTKTLSIQLCAGLIEPRPSYEELSDRRGESRPKVPGFEAFDRMQIDFGLKGERLDGVFVYDHEGRSIGNPGSVSRETSASTAVVQLGFEDTASPAKAPFKIVLDKNAFFNCEEAVLCIPTVSNQPGPVIAHRTGQSDPANPSSNFMSRVAVIACKRAGSHLMVPVSLDIHGRSIQTEFLLDTGASLTLVPRSIYTRGNAKPIDSLPTRQLQAVGGSVTVHIDQVRISIQGYSRERSVAISDSDLPLLGADYFEGSVFTVDLEGESIYLHMRSR